MSLKKVEIIYIAFSNAMKLNKTPKIQVIINFACHVRCMGSYNVHPCIHVIFWAIWLKEINFSDLKRTLKMGQI